MNNRFIINGREISKIKPPYIIAEVSANHKGSIDRAIKTIKAAKEAGVDAVKIQTYTPDTMTLNIKNNDFLIKNGLWKGRSLYDLYGEAYTPYEWHDRLFKYAKDINITLFSTPFDESAVDLLESLDVPAYKIASFEIVDLPLIKYIAKKNKPMLISTGMASIDETREAILAAKNSGCNNIAIFHCISSYPTPINEANIQAIQNLKKEFNIEVGLSDHTTGNIASIVATSLGATVIEKHFTLNRSEGGVDSSFSLEPHEMKLLVENTKSAHSSLGSGNAIRSKIENENLVFRRSLYFVKEVSKGEIITSENIKRIRPGFGLKPKYYNDVIGLTCQKNAKKGDRVTPEHFNKNDFKI
jgi:N-acetylneuraminate synthase